MANEVALRVGGLTFGALQNVAENRHIITSDGELLDVTLATDDDLVLWSIVTQRLRTLARNIEQGVNSELADRVRRTGGSISTPQGKASETISRGSVSGVASAQIRELLEAAAADGVIPWEAVDNVAPLVAHVTPQKAWQYAEDAPEEIREQLEQMIPAKRRTIKVDEAPA
jgi:hypothetical protein